SLSKTHSSCKGAGRRRTRPAHLFVFLRKPAPRAKQKQAVPAPWCGAHCLRNDLQDKTHPWTEPAGEMPASMCLIRTLQSFPARGGYAARLANILSLLLLTFHKWCANAREKGT